VHFLRNVVAACSRQDAPAVLALVKTVFYHSEITLTSR
jgi:hypothetical protein